MQHKTICTDKATGPNRERFVSPCMSNWLFSKSKCGNKSPFLLWHRWRQDFIMTFFFLWTLQLSRTWRETEKSPLWWRPQNVFTGLVSKMNSELLECFKRLPRIFPTWQKVSFGAFTCNVMQLNYKMLNTKHKLL